MTVKVNVPEGMLKAALESKFGYTRETMCLSMLEAALKWLSENPIVPTQEQIIDCLIPYCQIQKPSTHVVAAIEWQRRMFLEQENEVPEAIQDLIRGREDDDLIIEAYRRGKESK